MTHALPSSVVDADGHVLEHPDGMLRFAPAKFRDRIWHIEVRADGSEWLHFNGHTRAAGGLALAGTAGMSMEDRNRALTGKMKYSEVRPGAFAPAPRLPDLDRDGITQSVLYPTLLLSLPSLPDTEFAEVQANAYNEWLTEFCAYAPQRFFGVAVVPTQDMERAVRTIRRAKELGHVGVFIRPNPAIDGRKLNDPLYDPLWQTCQELQMPVGLHPFLAPDMPGACRALGYAEMRAKGVDYGKSGSADPVRNLGNIFFSQALANPFDMMECVALFCAGGILERFPQLTVLFLEANGGWIVSLLERLDHHFEIFRWDVPWLKMKPSEYFRRQCYISFDPDETTLRFTAEHPLVGAERIIWASDYPHPDAKFPGVVDELQQATAGLTSTQRAQIFGLNARALYHLPG
ncbi:MAG: amidohydrolase [Deltaproteobacteria bacterium]|nr:amidohydrolase [Deltaproteobacteria bacterium]MBI3388003.1 amidohydrolase [Deltaproteobacteria bacterium]